MHGFDADTALQSYKTRNIESKSQEISNMVTSNLFNKFSFESHSISDSLLIEAD